jgi:hypothetical protein
MSSATWIAALVCSLLWAGNAHADIPSIHFMSQQEGDMVRLDLSYFYHGSWIPDCGVLIERQRDQSEDWLTVFEGDLGEESMVCTCILWFTWQEGDPDAVGELCEPDDGYTSVQGSCPTGHTCHCTRTCKPLYDSPCNGTWSYRVEPQSFSHPYGPLTGYTSLTADFGGECEGEGGGCAMARTSPHVYVLYLFLLTILVPLWLRRRRS